MNYEKLIATLQEVSSNENIQKEGLVMSYELDAKTHKSLDKEIFTINNVEGEFTHGDIIEIEYEGVVAKITVKK